MAFAAAGHHRCANTGESAARGDGGGEVNRGRDSGGGWRWVRGIGIGVETGYQFNFDFGLVLDLGIGLNISDQVIQFAGDPAEDGFSIWPHPNVGVGWKF